MDDLLAERGAHLVIPPFLTKDRDRFTPEEELRTKIIARARIHVERFAKFDKKSFRKLIS